MPWGVPPFWGVCINTIFGEGMVKDFYGKWVVFMDWAEWDSLSSLATSLIRRSSVGKIFF
jgi:hypothetical protein